MDQVVLYALLLTLKTSSGTIVIKNKALSCAINYGNSKQQLRYSQGSASFSQETRNKRKRNKMSSIALKEANTREAMQYREKV